MTLVSHIKKQLLDKPSGILISSFKKDVPPLKLAEIIKVLVEAEIIYIDWKNGLLIPINPETIQIEFYKKKYRIYKRKIVIPDNFRGEKSIINKPYMPKKGG